jgi:hypothetical protein
MSFANYWENEILDHVFNKGAYSAPANIFVGLSTADPEEDASALAEPSGNGYARVSTAAADWDTASSGVIDNVNTIIFPTATGDWGTVTHFALFDAASGGNMLAYGILGLSVAVALNNTPRFTAAQLEISLD